MTKKQAEALCQKHAEQLGEHFASVQILVTYMAGKETAAVAWGSGDWYARRGMCQEFISRSHADNVASKLTPPEDEWKAGECP